MRLSIQSSVVFALATLLAIVLSTSTANARDRAYRVIHDFRGSSDGWAPVELPAIANNGDLYGTTQAGGIYNFGTVFKLTAPQTRGGAWAKTVLYNFPGVTGDDTPVYCSSAGTATCTALTLDKRFLN